MKKQKLLIVHNYYQIPGGEDTVVANEKKLLEDNGHEVILYTRNNSELKELSKLQKLLLPFTTVFNLRTYKEVKKLIMEHHIDVVHVHNTLNLISPSVYYAARRCKVPVVQTIHNFRLLCPGATFYRDGHICEDCMEKGLSCAIKHSCYRESKLQTLACVISTKFHRLTGIYGKINYICLTEFNKEKLLNLKQVKSEKVFVKPNFVDNTGNVVLKEQRKNQFIFAGRLDKLKGVDIMLEAWKLMGASAPNLIICGTGPMEDWCREFIEKNSLKNVQMKGFVPNDETLKLIADSKALVLPTQWYEGFPMSIVEAFSVGTPVITSDLGNAGSVVTEGLTGCKFKSDSAEELVNAVERLMGYKNIYETTYAEYTEKYTDVQNYESLVSIYRMINKKRKDINMQKIFKADYQRYKKTKWKFFCRFDLIKSKVLRYILFGRRAASAKSKFLRKLYAVISKLIGQSMGNEIDFSNIGEGLVLSHPYGITVNSGAVLGKDVTLFKGCTIGSIRSGKRSGIPCIGDRVTVCCNAMVCGGIHIGNDVLISAGAFVNFDVPDNSVVIGNPGVIYKKENASADYLT